MHSQKYQLACLTLALTAALPLPAQIDEILVTAQMREQPVEEVPVAVTSFDRKFMQLHRVNSLEALGDATPGLIIQEQSPNNPGYVIRGISTDEGSPVDAARISVFLNGADISRNRASLVEMHDIARVEVVKGPQATLFGTAASGGAISISTSLPEREFGGRLRLEAGNFGYRRIEGMATGGNQTWQGRLAFLASDREG